MNKIKLPISKEIFLESNSDQWRLFFRKLINNLYFFGIISIDDSRKVRISISIERVLPPELSRSETKCKTETDMGQDVSIGISRITEFLNDHLAKDCWLLFGHIQGENKIPILIMYYESINLAIYTQKLTTETLTNFVPKNINPQLN
jgi:hypothetical protein